MPNKNLMKENLFLLELQKNKGNLETLLTSQEKAIYQLFPSFHKKLFVLNHSKEWLIKTSLEKFSSSQVAQAKLSLYRQEKEKVKKVMSIDSLSILLFPLIDLSAKYFEETIVEAIEGDEITPCAWSESMHNFLGDNREASNQKLIQIYSSLLSAEKSDAKIHINDLQKIADETNNSYFEQCKKVWRGYLLENKKPDRLSELDVDVKAKRVEITKEIMEKHPSLTRKEQHDICKQKDDALFEIGSEAFRKIIRDVLSKFPELKKKK